jgi:hypothetical protein
MKTVGLQGGPVPNLIFCELKPHEHFRTPSGRKVTEGEKRMKNCPQGGEVPNLIIV